MYSSLVPSFVIDLNSPARTRWKEVAEACLPLTKVIIAEASEQLRYVPEFCRHLFAFYYRLRGGLYTDEMAAVAKYAGISVGTATMLNTAYELSHLHTPRLLGCTAGVRWIENMGMVHTRTVDWPLRSMGPATCIFRLRKGLRECVIVGVPGQISALSGMVPGGYSVTINWAPPDRNPCFNFGPLFLLRRVLETHDNYAEAVETLRSTPLSTSVFFTVCGINPGEGCIIERTQTRAVVRPLVDDVLVQANHYVSPQFQKSNSVMGRMHAAEFVHYSDIRVDEMSCALASCKDESDLEGVLNRPHVDNMETVQKMIFCPRTGMVRVWRRLQ